MSDTDRAEDLLPWVTEVCRELGLGVENETDDFFAVGGTSLAAVKLIARAEDAFGEDALPPEDLFARSRLEEIAATIAKHTVANGNGHVPE